MTTRGVLADGINHFLGLFDLQLVRRDVKYWDHYFARWVREAEARGTDPNDAGDDEWGADLLTENLPRYLSIISSDSVVLELGPGTGRLSRHLIGKCQRLIAIDQSRFVSEWLPTYLQGRGDFEIHLINGPMVPLPEASVDAIVSHGVVEHFDFDELYWFLREFRRVLKPDGTVLFNFVDATTDEAFELLHAHSSPGTRSIFRLHHPEMVKRLAERAGFAATIRPASGRVSFAELEHNRPR